MHSPFTCKCCGGQYGHCNNAHCFLSNNYHGARVSLLHALASLGPNCIRATYVFFKTNMTVPISNAHEPTCSSELRDSVESLTDRSVEGA